MRFYFILILLVSALAGCEQEEVVPFEGSIKQPTMDGYTYEVVAIGDQVWFAENLRTNAYANGDLIPSPLSEGEWTFATEGASWIYGEGVLDCSHSSPDINACDHVESIEAYGRLYNWYAVNDERGLCPVGWHVPSDEQWGELEDFIASTQFNYPDTMAWDSVGVLLKSTNGWADSNSGATGNGVDAFGFAAAPGGIGSSVGFGNAGIVGRWWTSTLQWWGYDGTDGRSWVRAIYGISPWVDRQDHSHYLGFSVRCVQDVE